MDKSKNVLITGAAGYIGKHVTKEFLKRGYNVSVSDFSHKGLDERVKICDVDIFSGDRDIYKKMGCPDVLVHLAWKDGFIHNSNSHMDDLSSHIIFLRNMIDGGLPSLSVMGSMHEIGYWEGAIDADTRCMPQSMYGISKNALRQALMLYVNDKPTVFHWLRAYYIYGDDARGSSIFAKLLQAVEDEKEKFPFTTGVNKFDFIHIDELARQIVSASVQDKYQGIINVCSGKAVSLAERVEEYIKENNLNISLDYGVFPDRPYDSPEVWGDAEIINAIMREESSETL